MKMRPLTGLDIPAGQPVTLKPGGEHIMLRGPQRAAARGSVLSADLDVRKGRGTRGDRRSREAGCCRPGGAALKEDSIMTPAAFRPRRRAVFAGLVILAAGGFLGLGLRETPKGAAGTLLGSAVGGAFRLVDQNGKTVSDADLKGKWSLDLFRLHALPGRLSDRAQRHIDRARRPRAEARRGPSGVHHRRSRTRHAGGAQILCRRASTRRSWR